MARSRTQAQGITLTAVRNGRCLVRNIRVAQRVAAAPELYLIVFNNNAPTVGTVSPTAQNMVIPVPAGNANVDAAVLDLAWTGKFGGLHFNTGLSYVVATTPNNANGVAGPTAGQEPEVIIDYEPLG